MFKKLRDKFVDEVKLAQQYTPFSREATDGSLESLESQQSTNTGASVHNAADNNQVLIDLSDGPQVISASNQQFSITDDDTAETPQDSPAKTFHSVSLTDSPVIPLSTGTEKSHSRNPSMTSITSDASLFAAYESPASAFTLQSDLESASEIEDHPGLLDQVTKEQLFTVLQKMRARCQKYKGRYTDLAMHYKETVWEKEKIKEIMSQSQDKALRRISELREQCLLEKKAKAHLEENLRSDLEERDLTINALQMKVDLLKQSEMPDDAGKETTDKVATQQEAPLIILEEDSLQKQEAKVDSKSVELITQKERVKRLEALLSKCKESIKANKERNNELTHEKEALIIQLQEKDQEVEKIKGVHLQEVDQLTQDLTLVKQEIEILRQHESEEEMTMAEAKMAIHQELQKKEEQQQILQDQVTVLEAEKKDLQDKESYLESEIIRLKSSHKSTIAEMQTKLENSERVLEEEKKNLLQDFSRGKAEAVRLVQQETERKLTAAQEEKQEALKNQDEEWERKMQEKIQELEGSHKKDLEGKEVEKERVLKLREEDFQRQFKEKEEESQMALEEKELQKKAAMAELENKKKELQDVINNINSKQYELQAIVDKCQDDIKVERAMWVQQIEDNRIRHLGEIEQLKETQSHEVAQLQKQHQEEMEKYIIDLKEKQRQKLDELRHEHEEMLQGSSADIGQSYENQMDLLKTSHEMSLQERDQMVTHLQEELQKKSVFLQEKEKLVETVEQKVENLGKILKEKELNITELQNSLQEKEKSVANVMKKNNALEERELQLRDQEKQMVDNNKCLQEEIQKKDKEMTELKGKLKEKHDVFLQLEQEMRDREDSIQHQLEERELLLQEKNNIITDMSSEAAVNNICKEKLENKIKDLKVELVALQQNFERVEKDKEYMCSSVDEKDRTVSQLEGLLRSLENARTEISSELECVKCDLNSAKNENEKLARENESAFTELHKTIDNMANEKTKLEDDIHSLENKVFIQEGYIENKNTNIADLEQKLAVAEEGRQRVSEQLDSVLRELEDVKASQYKLEEIKTSLEKEISVVSLEFESHKCSQEKAMQEEQEKKQLEAEKEQQLNEVKQFSQQLEEKLLLLQRTNEEQEDKIAQLEKSFTVLQENRDAVHLEKKTLVEEKVKLAEDLSHLQSSTVDRVQELTASQQTLLEEKQKLENQLDDSLIMFQASEAEFNKSEELHKNEKEELNAKIAVIIQENTQLEETLRAEISQLEQEKTQLKTKLTEVQLKNDGGGDNEINNPEDVTELHQRLEDQEQLQMDKIKQLVKDFELQLAEKEMEYEKTLAEAIRKGEQEGNLLVQQHREQLNTMTFELMEKSQAYDTLMEEHHTHMKAKDKEMEDSKLEYQKQQKIMLEQHQLELKSMEKKWQAILERQIANKEAVHQEEVEGLAKEWEWERKTPDSDASGSAAQELERASQVAIAVESGTNSLEMLRKQVIMQHGELENTNKKYREEVGELRRLLEVATQGRKLGSPLEEATELEYLKNILFEYMMGKESLTLAKVLAAIVKFDSNQTRKIMEREEQKLGLLGTMGFL